MNHQPEPTCVRLCIREIAEQQGLTPFTLSQKAGISPHRAEKLWRNAYYSIQTEKLGKIAQALNVSVKQLLEDSPASSEEAEEQASPANVSSSPAPSNCW